MAVQKKVSEKKTVVTPECHTYVLDDEEVRKMISSYLQLNGGSAELEFKPEGGLTVRYFPDGSK